MDKYRIDSHKLLYHVDRVSDWLKGKNICPAYIEISPAGSCNHRCIYCALDFMEYRSRFLDSAILSKRLSEMGSLGVKSIMYAGEGEPFLHKDIIEIIRGTKQAGIDTAITTNGVLFSEHIANSILKYLSWIKVSINAGTKDTYAKIHRTGPGDFDKVFKNFAYAVKIKAKKKLKSVLGMQLVLLPENSGEVATLAKKAKAIGMDYLVVKPYSQHPLSKTKKYKDIKYKSFFSLIKKLEKLNSPKFNVIFRQHTMHKWDESKRNYQHCLALPFWSYIDSMGNLWACSIYLTKKKFLLGNIYKQTFQEIINSKKRRDLLNWGANTLDTDKCRVNCRMDEVNRYLWELKNPPEHLNFI